MRELLSSEITIGVIGNAIYGISVLITKKFAVALERFHPQLRKLAFFLLAASVPIGNLLLYRFTRDLFPLFSTIFLAIAIFACWRQLKQFWDVGLIGADRTIRSGIDYKRSLGLCSNSLSFLGVGARKLTENSSEFEAALKRCNRPNRPVRFLLCKPTSALLSRSAQSAGEAINAYEHRVLESLKVIARLRKSRDWNIEVRFYQIDRPLFRLMFIDSWLCLASHYVFGEGDGSNWPQLQIRRYEAQRDVNSLYHPFEEYFEELWNSGEPWDFMAYI